MDKIQVEQAILNGADFKDISFCDANLTGVTFENCVLNNVKFNRSILTGTSFRGSKLTDIDFTGATFDKKSDFRDITQVGSTLKTICSSIHWGIAKFDGHIRDRLNILYRK